MRPLPAFPAVTMKCYPGHITLAYCKTMYWYLVLVSSIGIWYWYLLCEIILAKYAHGHIWSSVQTHRVTHSTHARWSTYHQDAIKQTHSNNTRHMLIFRMIDYYESTVPKWHYRSTHHMHCVNYYTYMWHKCMTCIYLDNNIFTRCTMAHTNKLVWIHAWIVHTCSFWLPPTQCYHYSAPCYQRQTNV